MYIFSFLPTPIYIIKEANQLLFKFLWKGVDKVTRLSTINSYKKGGLKAHIHPRCIARRGTVFIYENPPILFERESSEKAIIDHKYSFPPA